MIVRKLERIVVGPRVVVVGKKGRRKKFTGLSTGLNFR
jgi:hypothetical protein